MHTSKSCEQFCVLSGGMKVCSAVVDLTDGTSLKQLTIDTSSTTVLEMKLSCNWTLVLSELTIRYESILYCKLYVYTLIKTILDYCCNYNCLCLIVWPLYRAVYASSACMPYVHALRNLPKHVTIYIYSPAIKAEMPNHNLMCIECMLSDQLPCYTLYSYHHPYMHAICMTQLCMLHCMVYSLISLHACTIGRAIKEGQCTENKGCMVRGHTIITEG